MRRFALLAGFLLFAAFTLDAEALRGNPYRGAIVAEAYGRVLFADRADARAYPASVSKLMTALLVTEDIAASRYSYDSVVTMTKEVRLSEPSWLDLKAGEQMCVRDLLFALLVESANDSAIALAIHANGSIDAFVARMNARARELGMSATTYFSPNGLPPSAKLGYPWKGYNVSTARDQLKLAREIVRHPELRAFTSAKVCDLVRTPTGYRIAVVSSVNSPPHKTLLAKGEKIVRQLENHNNIMCMAKLRVLNSDGLNAVDGLKTGYINDGGSSVVLTAVSKGRRFIVVVLGSEKAAMRDEHAHRLLTDVLGAFDW